MIKFARKEVSLAGVYQPAWEALRKAEVQISIALGYTLTLYSVMDGKHNAYRSEHYRGCGFDMRTWTTPNSGVQISGNTRDKLRARVIEVLGENWIVLDEKNHFHLGYRPVYNGDTK